MAKTTESSFKKVRLTLSLDKEVDTMLRSLANENHTTMSQWISDQILSQYRSQKRKSSRR